MARYALWVNKNVRQNMQKDTTFTFRISQSDMMWLKSEAKQAGKSIAHVVVSIVKEKRHASQANADPASRPESSCGKEASHGG